MRSAGHRAGSKTKTPSSVFKSCPSCDSPNLLKFEGEAFCDYCGWDSIALRVEARFAARQVDELGTIETISAREDAAAERARRLLSESPFLTNQEPVVA